MHIPLMRLHLPLAILCLFAGTASGNEEVPLFAATTPLEFRLELPFSAMRHSDRGVEHPGALVFNDGARLEARFGHSFSSSLLSSRMPAKIVYQLRVSAAISFHDLREDSETRRPLIGKIQTPRSFSRLDWRC